MLDRRAFLCGSLAMLGAPLGAESQQEGKIARIGLLVAGPRPEEHSCVLALRRGLVEMGYVEGRTHVLEIRWVSAGPKRRFPTSARSWSGPV